MVYVPGVVTVTGVRPALAVPKLTFGWACQIPAAGLARRRVVRPQSIVSRLVVATIGGVRVIVRHCSARDPQVPVAVTQISTEEALPIAVTVAWFPFVAMLTEPTEVMRHAKRYGPNVPFVLAV